MIHGVFLPVCLQWKFLRKTVSTLTVSVIKPPIKQITSLKTTHQANDKFKDEKSLNLSLALWALSSTTETLCKMLIMRLSETV